MHPFRDITNDYNLLPNGKRQLLAPYVGPPKVLKKVKIDSELKFALNPALFKSEDELQDCLETLT